jgi:glucosylceramidase
VKRLPLGAGAVAAALVICAVAAPASSATGVEVFQTTADLSERLGRLPDIHFRSRSGERAPMIHVDDRIRYQRVKGVGAAMTDSSAWLIHRLGPRAQAALLNALFGGAGIRLNFLRVPVGASDFTAHGRPYTYDDLPRGRSDPQLLHFSIAHDRGYIIPTLRRALAFGRRLEILANPWSPPAWMKANDSLDNIRFQGSLLAPAYQPLAEYFVKFIQAYGREGIPISAITPQNEPVAAVPYPGMALLPGDESSLIIHHLRPAFAAAGLRTLIYGYDSGWESTWYAKRLLSKASGALDGIAWHCYSGTPAVMSEVHHAAPALDEIVSECAPGLTTYPVPDVLIGSLRNWASIVALWNVALDPAGGPVEPPNSGCRGCSGVVTIDARTRRVSFLAAYYQLGQVSRFVRPGAVRIGSEHYARYVFRGRASSSVTDGLDDVAFLNPDGSRVLVAYDNSGAPIHFVVAWHWRSFRYTLAPGAMTTFVWRA